MKRSSLMAPQPSEARRRGGGLSHRHPVAHVGPAAARGPARPRRVARMLSRCPGKTNIRRRASLLPPHSARPCWRGHGAPKHPSRATPSAQIFRRTSGRSTSPCVEWGGWIPPTPRRRACSRRRCARAPTTGSSSSQPWGHGWRGCLTPWQRPCSSCCTFGRAGGSTCSSCSGPRATAAPSRPPPRLPPASGPPFTPMRCG
mmetsp:Transcript_72397/g.228221  ORF Transcript_72397/g.228221 Transcript_72397/m.228221 type:complete len:201 (-) Transcript_72397:543-1145(-)